MSPVRAVSEEILQYRWHKLVAFFHDLYRAVFKLICAMCRKNFSWTTKLG